MDFVYFLGRFHVLMLHLPLGMLTLAVVLELFARLRPSDKLDVAILAAWWGGAITAILTVVLGFMHATEEGFQGSPGVEAHRWSGTALALAACLIAAWRWRASRSLRAESGASAGQVLYRKLMPVSVGLIVVLMFFTGHLGGNLTHGSTYLVQYAPQPVRTLLGLSTDSGPRPKASTVASADIFRDVVAPAFEQRCLSCHNEDKKRGGLSLVDYDAVMRGGKEGVVVIAGDAEGSELFRRITLAHDDDDFMPQDNKTPLTEQQVVAIGWWIAQGAPQSAAIGSLKTTPEVEAALAQILGVEAGNAGAGEEHGPAPAAQNDGQKVIASKSGTETIPEVPAGTPEAVSALESNGFVVRPISLGSNLLDINLYANKKITDDDVANLGKLGVQIRTLDLRRSGLSDDQLKAIGPLPNIVLLRLEETAVTDRGLSALSGSEHLQYLNLYGTGVTDAGIKSLAVLRSLKELHVWQTAVTQKGADGLRAAIPSVEVTLAGSLHD